MVEAQQARLDEFGERGLVDIASDANRMHMRRMVERLIAEEQARWRRKAPILAGRLAESGAERP